MLLRWLSKQSIPLLVLLLVFIAYLPCLKAGFVNWDDDRHFLDNPMVTSLNGKNLSDIWTSTINYTYIPLTTTTWAIEYHFFGFNPFVFHLDNLILHLAITAMVIIFSQRLGLTPLVATLAGLIFGLHPMHVESVAWVTERKDVLYGFFYMAALLAYLQYLDSKRRTYFWLSVLLLTLSVCAKSMAISFPFVALILDWFRGRKQDIQSIREKCFYFAILIPISFVTFFQNSVHVQPQGGQGILIWIWCLIFYLYKFIFPKVLILFYWLPLPITLSNPQYILSIAATGIFLILLWIYRKNRLIVFAFLFYLASIFFLLRFHPILGLVSDRFMYLPSIGICIVLAEMCRKINSHIESKLIRKSFQIIICLLIIGMAYRTWEQCKVWRSSQTLWENELKYNSKTGTGMAYCKLANARVVEKKKSSISTSEFKEISELYQKSIHENPNFAEAYFGLGNIFELKNNWVKAEYYYKEALKRDAKNAEAYFRLGRIYQKRNQPIEAIGYFHKAMENSPYNILLGTKILKVYEEAIAKHEDEDIYQREKAALDSFVKGKSSIKIE